MNRAEANRMYQHALEAERQAVYAMDDYSREHRPTADMVRDLKRITDQAWLALEDASEGIVVSPRERRDIHGQPAFSLDDGDDQ